MKQFLKMTDRKGMQGQRSQRLTGVVVVALALRLCAAVSLGWAFPLHFFPLLPVLCLILLVVALQVDLVLLVLAAVARCPCHLVLLLQPPPGVGEPGGHLCQGHLGDDGQHDLLPLGGVGVLAVFTQPGLQSGRGVPRGVLPIGGITVRVGAQRPKWVVVQSGDGRARRLVAGALKQGAEC